MSNNSMLGKSQLIIFVAVIGFAAYTIFGERSGLSNSTETPSVSSKINLGQVLDRSGYALEEFSNEVQNNDLKEVSEANLDALSGYMAANLNAQPEFYDKPLGVAVQQDASFLGFDDTNQNGVKDEGEDQTFTLEIDSANERLIATDESGTATHSNLTSGLLTGFLIGSLLNRQSRAGVTPSSFNKRQTTARSAYTPPRSSNARPSARSSARSGGLSGGK